MPSSGPTDYPASGPVPYDDGWPVRFEDAATELLAIVGGDWRVEHVGSTSVPGLLATPVIDLAVRVPGGLGLRDVDARLAEAGRVEVATEVCAREGLHRSEVELRAGGRGPCPWEPGAPHRGCR